MSQSPASSSMVKTPATAASASNFNAIFEKALKAYTKKTKQDLTANPLATQLQECNSPEAIMTILQDQIDQFRQSQRGDERLQKWLSPTINVLYAFSETLGQGVGLVNINRSVCVSRKFYSTGFPSCSTYFCRRRRPPLGECRCKSTRSCSRDIGVY